MCSVLGMSEIFFRELIVKCSNVHLYGNFHFRNQGGVCPLLLNGEPDRVLIVCGSHDSNFMGVIHLFHPFDSGKGFKHALLVHGRGRLVVGIDGIFIVEGFGSIPLLTNAKRRD